MKFSIEQLIKITYRLFDEVPDDIEVLLNELVILEFEKKEEDKAKKHCQEYGEDLTIAAVNCLTK